MMEKLVVDGLTTEMAIIIIPIAQMLDKMKNLNADKPIRMEKYKMEIKLYNKYKIYKIL